LQYLIVDEILLARVLEQQPQKVAPGEEYTDETEEEETDEYMDNEETEYDTRKGRPVIV
jgi:hypothetical protein